MSPQEKANELVNKYRIILMSEDTDCGNEVLCTSIAKKCALIAVDEILETVVVYEDISKDYQFWQEVKQKIERL
jgi:hypothetical protein